MRVLIAVGSKHGSTHDIAEMIGQVLREHGLEVSVENVESLQDVSGYQAVVLGSAVYAGNWLPSARRFVQYHIDDLKKLPVWLFSSGPIGNPPKPDPEKSVDISQITNQIPVREHHVFTGKLDISQLGFSERLLMKTMRVQEGDYRNWADIRKWATVIARDLMRISGALLVTRVTA